MFEGVLPHVDSPVCNTTRVALCRGSCDVSPSNCINSPELVQEKLLLGLFCQVRLKMDSPVLSSFPGYFLPKHLLSTPLREPHSFTQLQWENASYFYGVWRTEEKYPCGVGTERFQEERTPEISGRFTPAPVRAEIRLRPHTSALLLAQSFLGHLAALVQTEGSQYNAVRSGKTHCPPATVGEKSQEKQKNVLPIGQHSCRTLEDLHPPTQRLKTQQYHHFHADHAGIFTQTRLVQGLFGI